MVMVWNYGMPKFIALCFLVAARAHGATCNVKLEVSFIVQIPEYSIALIILRDCLVMSSPDL